MKILGLPGLKQTGQKRTHDPVRGVVTEVTFEGLFNDVALGELSLSESGAYYEADYSNPPVARLTLRTPDNGDGTKPKDGILATTYDLDGNSTGKHLFEHWRCKALGQTVLDKIRNAVDNRTSDGTLTGDAITVLDMMKFKEDSYVVGQFVFKVTHIINNKSEVAIAYANSSCVYATDAMIAETEPTALYLTGINSAVATVRDDYYNGTIPTGHTLGWLKNPPSINNIAGNRSAVVVEYMLEAWRNFAYPLITLS